MAANSGDAAEKTLKCIRCGFCLDACPTFRLTGNEADSPRGRIYIMRSILEGEIPLDSSAVDHLDACLGCRACETACPSGVEYSHILESFRADLESKYSRPAPRRFAHKQLLATLTNPALLAASLKAAGLLKRFMKDGRTMPGFAAALLTGSENAEVILPTTPEKIEVGKLPERNPPIGEKRYTVAILAGCVMRVLFNPTNLATIRVLQQNGCEVIVPKASGCCGALHLHSGYVEIARDKARALIESIAPYDIDAFVVNSAGCGSALKEYGELLAGDPRYAGAARRFAAKVRDVSEWLMEIGLTAPAAPLPIRVAYHDACHLAHGQKITAAPRALLKSIPGLDLIEIAESDTCCGSAGIYNLTQPEMARRLQQRKVDFIAESGAEILATGNPGCLAWIQQGLQERGIPMKVLHPVEILDSAYQDRLPSSANPGEIEPS